MIRIGLTGSIGMGKSTTARMFAAKGVPAHDSDAAVHKLYAGRAAPEVEAAFPGTVIDGQVDRARLAPHVLGKPEAMKRLEGIIHPLVGEEETAFLKMAMADRRRAVLLDIPLLFESGADDRVDVCVVVTASPDIQRQRVLARPGMTRDKFDAILGNQMPDSEKRLRAHFLIDTGAGLASAERAVTSILKALAGHP